MVLPDPAFKSLGLISIIMAWTGLLFLIYRWRGNKSMSFSLHAAQTKAGQIYYFILFAITLPLFFAFVLKWYVPALNLPSLFTYLVAIGVAGQIIAVIVPAVGGRKEKIHDFGAYLMAATIIPTSLIVALADIPIAVRALAILGVGYMIAVWILHFGLKQIRSHYLYFQAAYVAFFHLIIISSTYFD